MEERCEICGARAPLHWSNGDRTGICLNCSGAVETVMALRAECDRLRAQVVEMREALAAIKGEIDYYQACRAGGRVLTRPSCITQAFIDRYAAQIEAVFQRLS